MPDRIPFLALPVAAVRGWPARRWLVAGALAGPLTALYASAGPSWRVWWVLPAAVVSAVLAALLLASYLPAPRSGRLLDAGCSPCAVVSGTTILGSLAMRSTAPLEPGIALVAVLLVATGLAQRLGAAVSCPVPPPGGSAGGQHDSDLGAVLPVRADRDSAAVRLDQRRHDRHAQAGAAATAGAPEPGQNVR
jgi:hypothetical protein